VVCPECGEKFRVLRASHARQHGYPDLEAFKKHHGIKFVTAASLLESRNKNLQPCMPGRVFTPEHKANISRAKLGRKTGPRGPAFREKLSRIRQAACEEQRRLGLPLFAGIKGKWVPSEKADQDVWVRSSWEARLVRALDWHPDVLEVEVEPFSIPYVLEGISRNYTPDFLVSFHGWEALWEVKPAEFVGTPKNQAKLKALRQYAAQHNLDTAVITLPVLERFEREAFLLAGIFTPTPESG